MWASTATECARSNPANSSGRAATAGRPYAPSTWNQTPRSSQMSAIASSGSIAPVSVVPAVATTAIGVTPSARSRSIASARAPGCEPAFGAERDRAQVRRADAERLDRPGDRVMHLLRAVDRHALAAEPLVARAGQGVFARGGERGRVRDRATARERPGRIGRVADELGRPADRLLLDQRRGSRVDREVDVVGMREQVADRPDLEPARTHPDEVPGPGLRDRLVEDPRRIVDRLVRRTRRRRELGQQEPADAFVERGLLGPVAVEALPGLRDELGSVLEHLFARGVEPQRDVGLGHGSDATRPGSRSGATAGRRSAPT